MFIAVFFLSTMDVAIKWLSAYYSAFQVSFFRGAFSLPFVLLWFAKSRSLNELKTKKPLWHILRGVMSVLFLLGVVIGLRELTITNAYTLFFAAPILVAVLSAVLLRENVGWYRWTAIMVGMIGVLIALQPGVGDFLTLGSVSCLLGVLGYSFTVVIIKKMSDTETTFSMIVYFLISVTIGSGLLSLFDWHELRWADWPAFLVLGLTGAVGQYFITVAFRCAPASVVAPIEYSALVWGALYGYFIWREIPETSVWIGATVIIASGAFIMHREAKITSRKNRKKMSYDES